MAIRIQKPHSNWDNVDPIYVGDAIVLWHNVNPQDQKAREAVADEIKKNQDLFYDGKERGYLNFPTPLDERRTGDLGAFLGDSDYYLTRKELKAFANEIGQKPLFLFPKKGLEKRYNIPPKPYKHKFNSPSWEYIKRSDTLLLASVFEMFFGKGVILNVDLENLTLADNPSQPESDILNLFATGMIRGYFGNFIKHYGKYAKGSFGNLDKGFTPLYACPLPTHKVFLFIQEKNVTGLLKSYGYETHPGLTKLTKYFSLKEGSSGLVAQSQNKNRSDKPKTSSRGRPGFPYSLQFVSAVQAQHKNGIPKNTIPFKGPVTRTFARDVQNEGAVVSAEEYKKIYGWSLRKVRENVRKVLSEEIPDTV
jgi:hypothetical protein